MRLGEKPLGAGQGTRKESAERNSFPGSALQMLLSLLSRLLKVSKPKEQAEKARAIVKNPWLAGGLCQSSQCLSTRESMAKRDGLMGH